jgi:hypothetical protein
VSRNDKLQAYVSSVSNVSEVCYICFKWIL